MTPADQNKVQWHRWENGLFAMVITYKGKVFRPMGAYASKEAALMAGEQRLKMFGDNYDPAATSSASGSLSTLAPPSA